MRAIGGRLYVPDADPPYNGFGVVDHGTEGYVFLSDATGHFAPASMPHFRLPGRPGPETAGAAVLPRAYHVIDVIRFRGRLYASTGSVLPTERAWHGASPGALHVASADLARWSYEVDYPFPWRDGVWRLGFMVRFRDALYAGIEDYDGREPNDYVVFAPAAESTAIRREDAHPGRVTPNGAALTLRWYADGARLYWITLERGGTATLRVTSDGSTWTAIDLPVDAGRPTDITRFRDALVVLTYRLEDAGPTLRARVTERKTPFELSDAFCSAPIAVYRDALYAGGQRDGALYRLGEGAAP